MAVGDRAKTGTDSDSDTGPCHALTLIGDSGGVVNFLDFCPASLKSVRPDITAPVDCA